MRNRIINAQPSPILIGRIQVAELLGCSPGHIDNLDAARRIPAAVRVGRLKKWPRAAILEWIEAGCPPRVDRPEKATPQKPVPTPPDNGSL
jgi:excisionase family DNA binding protein